MINRKIAISVILIIVLGFAAYSNSINNGFIWDDEIYITENTHIKSWAHIKDIFKENVGSGAARSSALYRPFQMLTYTLEYPLWKLNAAGYHLTNIILHILAALCIYWLVFLLYGNIIVPLLTGVFFAVHPLFTEAVSYISGRSDSLGLLFFLLAFVLYVKNIRSRKLWLWVLMLLSYAAAILSRENSLILPVMFVFYHYTFKEKIRRRELSAFARRSVSESELRRITLRSPPKLLTESIKGRRRVNIATTGYARGVPFSLLAVSGLYIILRFTLLSQQLCAKACPTGFFTRLAGFLAAIADYMRLLFLPFGLHMEYGQRLFSFFQPKVILGLAILVLSLLYAFKQRRKDSLVFFGITWFFIALLPVSNLYPLNAYMYEHWLYMPSIGFFLLLAGGLSRLYKKKNLRIAVVLFCAGLAVFYIFLARRQNVYWGKPLEFYQRLLKYAPDSPRALNNLGKIYGDSGEYEKAIPLYQKAIAVDPSYVEAYNNLGVAYQFSGQDALAVAMYKKAIAVNPSLPQPYNNLGNVYRDARDYPQAIAMFNKAIEIKPDFHEPYNNLGIAYKLIGKNEQAISAYEKAIACNSAYTNAYYNLANLYKDTASPQKAIELYKAAIRLNPQFVNAYNNLAAVLIAQGRQEEALQLYRKAIEINPKYAYAYNNLLGIYHSRKEYDAALKYYVEAVKNGVELDKEIESSLEDFLKRE